MWRDTPRAFAQDPKTLALVLEGLTNGHYDALRTPWERTFFTMPLVHCEAPDHRILGRESTPKELGYLERGVSPHQREMPRFDPALPGVEPDRPRKTPPPSNEGGAPISDLYYWPTPNGWKASIMLEECGLE